MQVATYRILDGFVLMERWKSKERDYRQAVMDGKMDDKWMNR